MREIGTVQVAGLTLRADPAREPCFKVVRYEGEMDDVEGSGEAARREMVHRHMSNEITSLEIAAQCLADFPHAPWELRLELARQCWDESRHVCVLARRLREMGGRKGDFPISVFEWTVTSVLETLPGRLATQNRTFEAGAMDVVGGLIGSVRRAGDPATAEVLEGILADEVQHVRFANRWIKKMASEDPRVLMAVAAAVRFLARANDVLKHSAGQANPAGQPAPPAVNVEDRRLAEFNDEEIREILRQAGFRSLLGEPESAA